MAETRILGARLAGPIHPDGASSLVDIQIEDGRITQILPAAEGQLRSFTDGVRIIEARGAWAAPGYIDIHTHGGDGADIMDATPEAVARVARFHLRHGTTSFVPTTLTAPLERVGVALDAVRQAIKEESFVLNFGTSGHDRHPGARILGAHMEGPFLAAKNAGAQDRSALRTPDAAGIAFVKANADILRRITIAPELPGALDLIRLCKTLGIRVSAGHDGAVDDEILAAIDAGLESVTHLYCCTSGISRRTGPRKHLGLTEIGMLEDRLTAEVIADRQHTPDLLFVLILRAKGHDRLCLVSDSLSIAGMPDGEYLLGPGGHISRAESLAEGGPDRAAIPEAQAQLPDGMPLIKTGDEAFLPSIGLYAGSATPLSRMVQNIVTHCAVPLADAIHMATAVPARLLGLEDRGDLREGTLADINLLGDHGELRLTLLGGIPVGH
jgi:N-acetylglucosamine-6-phosphate deacetylase